ncbi:hypothetical protein [Jannaschia seohaensis]|uniref:Uncharacterized protein n=1 Tax=Jannaschia seohaensis TaxID=475081 RepID=A0A2Y9ABG4_9RHOB|nr:hypothetical protein [Jannaschia seohaensis]PWJ20876.1 hypothetical protein BCF38_102122 [Jannaschia seohaensis]SSA41286.1 hypothetical protein SAMN05421539_102122 [Jannaschia seohaensis]
MVRKTPTGHQPRPPSPRPPRTGKETTREGDKTKYDTPSRAEDDFAIDEQREKRIRGDETPKDVHVPD